MSQLYEHYNVGDDHRQALQVIIWGAHTFTPSIAHKITYVMLKLFRYGNPGPVTVSIRATDGNGHPTGEDLCSETIDGNGLTTNNNGDWYEITLGAGCDLAASTKYAIVVRVPNSSWSYMIGWRTDTSSPTYVDGNVEESSDSGLSWTAIVTKDFMFEEWGEPLAPPAVGMSHAFIIG